MSTFWSGWIIVLTSLNILGCWWLIRWTMKKRVGESAEGDVTGHSWDGDLCEYNNPLPRWWLWLFYITLVFGVGYLVLFPGMGNWQGLLGWSSGNTLNADSNSQYASEMQAARNKYDPIYEQYASVAVADLATQPQYAEARDMGKRLYLTYCMQCHQSDAAGARGYPNLTDDAWLFGGSPEQIKVSIAQGRQSIGMPAYPQLGEESIATLAAWLSGDTTAAGAGKALYTSSGCLGCHGLNGEGNVALGAPNLMDQAWVYGGNVRAITKTLEEGRKGVMPAHQELLGDDKIHLLTAYVYSLSR